MKDQDESLFLECNSFLKPLVTTEDDDSKRDSVWQQAKFISSHSTDLSINLVAPGFKYRSKH